MMKTRLAAILLLLLPGPVPAQTPATSPAAVKPVAPVAVPQPPVDPHPAIWLLADADTRIYIFGTVHALSRGLRWRSATFDRIALEAEELVLEVNEQDLSSRGPNLFASMMMGKSVPILQRVSPDRREGLARMLRELGAPENAFDGVETWAAATLLGLAQAGLRAQSRNPGAPLPDPGAGVELTLMREFHGRNRPISAAENAAELLANFRRMPLDVQREMLDQTVDAYLNGTLPGEPTERNWITANLDAIGAMADSLPPRLQEMLITRRNRGFADWLVRRLERPGTVLFAIGAGHLAGRVSVQSMLESRGLHVQRIE